MIVHDVLAAVRAANCCLRCQARCRVEGVGSVFSDLKTFFWIPNVVSGTKTPDPVPIRIPTRVLLIATKLRNLPEAP